MKFRQRLKISIKKLGPVNKLLFWGFIITTILSVCYVAYSHCFGATKEGQEKIEKKVQTTHNEEMESLDSISKGVNDLQDDKEEDEELRIKTSKMNIDRLIDDHKKDVELYYEFFLKESDRISEKYASLGSGRSSGHLVAHRDHSKEGKRYLGDLSGNVKRNIEDISLETFETDNFKGVVELSDEINEYNLVIEFTNSRIKLIEDNAKYWEALIE